MILSTEPGRRIETKLDETYQKSGSFLGAIETFDARLANHTRYLSRLGISHRGFLVGGTIPSLLLAKWTENESLEKLVKLSVPIGNVVLLEGANKTIVQGDPRDCPEKSMCEYADTFEEKGIGKLVFGHIYTAGPGNPREIATSIGYETDTLPPCDTCRPIIEDCDASWPGLPYSTLAYDTPARIDYTLKGILDRHQNVIPPPSSEMLKNGGALLQ